MSLKDVKEYAKDELKSDEVLLESVFKFESFLKKYKVLILAVIVVAVLALIGFFIYGEYKEHKNEKANEALVALATNPNDKGALSELKSNNEMLYELYALNQATQKQDTKTLQELSSSQDEMIASLSKYTLNVMANRASDESAYYKDLNTILEVYQAINAKNFSKANMLLDAVPQDSPLINVATLYRHYTISGVSR